MQLFFAHIVEDSKAFLDQEETRHCTKTLRKKVGDSIHFVDGKGGFFVGIIVDFNKKSCELSIEQKLPKQDQRDFKIHIAIAPTKNINRLEWFLEKTTEFGIDEITLLLCQRSERKNIRLDRLQKIVVSAAKQSLKSQFPKLNDLIKFKHFVKTERANTTKTIAHCNSSDLIPLSQIATSTKDILILIGPEGDFSEEEVNLALENGFVGVGLGTSRLRTETAGIAACHTVHIIQNL